MAGESVWIVTWLPLLTRVAHKRKALSPEHREFDDPTNAFSFVMELDESVRATATIRRAGDDAISLQSSGRCTPQKHRPKNWNGQISLEPTLIGPALDPL
jgi:hypothetical protein